MCASKLIGRYDEREPKGVLPPREVDNVQRSVHDHRVELICLTHMLVNPLFFKMAQFEPQDYVASALLGRIDLPHGIAHPRSVDVLGNQEEAVSAWHLRVDQNVVAHCFSQLNYNYPPIT